MSGGMKLGDLAQAVEDLEEMGLVERCGDVVTLTAAGRQLTALRKSVRDEGGDPDEDLILVEEKPGEYAVYDTRG